MDSRTAFFNRDLGCARNAGICMLGACDSDRMVRWRVFAPCTLFLQESQHAMDLDRVWGETIPAIFNRIHLSTHRELVDERLNDKCVVRKSDGAPRIHWHVDCRMARRDVKVWNPVLVVREAFDNKGIETVFELGMVLGTALYGVKSVLNGPTGE